MLAIRRNLDKPLRSGGVGRGGGRLSTAFCAVAVAPHAAGQGDVVELAAVSFAGGRATAAREWLLPTGTSPAGAAVAPDELAEVLAGQPLVAADAAAMSACLAAIAEHWEGFDPPRIWDVVSLARLVFPLAPAYEPEALCQYLGMPEPAWAAPGQAARVAGELFAAALARLDGMEPGVLAAILRLAPPAWTLAPLVEGALARQQEQGASLRPPLHWVHPAAGPLHGDAGALPVDASGPGPEAAADLLGPGGPIATRFDQYEHRPQQQAMADQVGAAFHGGLHVLVEAGTGTGKSLAYLLPAMLWARQTGERVLVATHTIALQEQLWQKDIPFLKAAMNLDIPVSLAKGRSNYVCLRKWEEALDGVGLATSDEEREFHRRAVAWMAATETGDKAELAVSAEEEPLWRQIMSETETCIGPKCQWYNRHCFAFRARRRARESSMVVANHSLLLADRKTGGQVLPPYRYLVVDEAHHLEGVATEQLGINLSHRDLAALLQHLVRGPYGAGGKALLGAWRRRMPGPFPAAPPVGQPPSDLYDALSDLVLRAREAVETLFRLLAGAVAEWADSEEDEAGRQLRLTEVVFLHQVWRSVEIAADNAVLLLRRLGAGLAQLAARLEDLDPRPDGADSVLVEVQRHAGGLEQAAADVETVLAATDANMVYWVESAGRPGAVRVTLRSAPVRVGSLLRQQLWDDLHGAVLCSATLTVDGRFDHARASLGLDLLPADRVAEASVTSPFHYQEQALVLIPNDLPNPRQEAAFTRGVTDFLGTFLPGIGGRALVLFTSHRQLRSVYNDLKGPMADSGLRLLAQGLDGHRTRLVAEFKGGVQPVLFGSATFWEGIDIPGEQLSCVVLVRLPFAPPTHPVLAARGEDLERRGLSSFAHLALPQAIIRFKQGFGRLIRTRTDRGIVVVLDGRAHPERTGYGRRFLRSLPGPRVFLGSAAEVALEAVHFLQRRDPPAHPPDQR